VPGDADIPFLQFRGELPAGQGVVRGVLAPVVLAQGDADGDSAHPGGRGPPERAPSVGKAPPLHHPQAHPTPAQRSVLSDPRRGGYACLPFELVLYLGTMDAHEKALDQVADW